MAKDKFGIDPEEAREAFGDQSELTARAGEAPMRAAALKHGITAEFLLLKAKEELEAEETKFFAHEGKVEDERNVVAWKVRQEARKDLQKALGLYPAEKHEIAMSPDMLRAFLDALPDELRKDVEQKLLERFKK